MRLWWLVLCVACGRVGFDEVPGDAPETAGVVTVGFGSPAELQDEASGLFHVDVSLSVPAPAQITVRYAVTGGTATRGADYLETDGVITFAPGDTTAQIDLTIVADAMEEPDETITLSLSSPSGAVLGQRTHTITISANVLPRINFMAADSAADESISSRSMLVTLSMPSTLHVSVHYSVSGTAGDLDDDLLADTITFNPGETSYQVTFGVTDDALDEEDETVIATLDNPTNALLGDIKVETARILDNDAAPDVQFAAATYTPQEDAGTQVIGVVLSAPSGRMVKVEVTAAGGTATAADYALSGEVIMIPVGQTTGTATMVITDDLLDEDDETAVLSLISPVNVTIAGNTGTIATIVDNDLPPVVQWSGGTQDQTIPEGNVAATLTTYTVTLSQASGRLVQVDCAIGGNARNPEDYSISGIPIMFNPGELTHDVVVSTVADTIVDAISSQDVQLLLSNPTNATLGADLMRDHTIVDDD